MENSPFAMLRAWLRRDPAESAAAIIGESRDRMREIEAERKALRLVVERATAGGAGRPAS